MFIQTETTTAAAESANNTMNTFLYVVVGSLLAVFLFRAAMEYRKYKRSIFPRIYDNYLIDYFYKLNVFRDASVSQKIKKSLGYHRLVYANVATREGKMAAQIMVLIHPKGVLSLAYMVTSGKLSGNDSGNWYIKREENGTQKKYKTENQAVYLREYNTHLRQVLADRKIESAIALSDDCDITNLNPAFKVIHFSEVEELIKEADCGYALNQSDVDDIYEKLGGRLSH